VAKTRPFDAANYLRTSEDMAAYLNACLEECEGDAAFIASALGDFARARGMTRAAIDAGLSLDSVPSFETILKVMDALGLKLKAEVAKP